MCGDTWNDQDALIVFHLYTCFCRLSSFRGVNKVVEATCPAFPIRCPGSENPPTYLPPTIALSIPPPF